MFGVVPSTPLSPDSSFAMPHRLHSRNSYQAGAGRHGLAGGGGESGNHMVEACGTLPAIATEIDAGGGWGRVGRGVEPTPH